jgi:hypothetical protein
VSEPLLPDALDPFDDDERIAEAFAEATAEAARRHKQAGVPMVAWQDDRVVLIPPSQIVISDGNKEQVA